LIESEQINSRRCANCGLLNFAFDEQCKRCGAALSELDRVERAANESNKNRSIFKRALFTTALILALLFIWYVSLLATSDPISFEQKQTVHRAIKVLEERGFTNEAFVLRNAVSYRATDNWWNRLVGHATAYAATNFPFEVVTLYPDFFNVPVDDVERAMILLHESNHLRGRGEPAAFSNVWREKAQLGWIKETYGQTRIWKNVRNLTMQYAPELFQCGLDASTDCTQ
jgi:hypothetical protein